MSTPQNHPAVHVGAHNDTPKGMPSPLVCKFCGSGRIVRLPNVCRMGNTHYSALRCESCGCLFHDLDVSKVCQYPTTYHAYNRFRWLSPKSFLLGKRTYKACRHAGLKKGLLFDVGCGSGHVLKMGKLLGYESIGFDLPGPAAAELKQQGFSIFNDWETGRKQLAGKCDVVTCWHTLEHVPSPVELLDNLTAVLKPGGILSLEVPDSDLLLDHHRQHPEKSLELVANFPEHINIPTRTWAAAELKKRGFEIKRVYTPRDGAFYAIYLRFIMRPDITRDTQTGSVFTEEPPPFKQALAFLLSCALEPLGPLVTTPTSFHIIAKKLP